MMLLIAGLLVIGAGLVLAAVGIRQGSTRIEAETQFPEAEAAVVGMEVRWRIITVHHILPVGAVREFSPQLAFTTAAGEDVRAALPYMLGISKEIRVCREAEKEGLPVLLRYDPVNPVNCYYGDKRGFRLREVFYKLLISGLLMLLGSWLVWWQYHI